MEFLLTILIAVYIVIGLGIIILTLIQGKDDEGASGAVMGGGGSFYEKNKGRTKEGRLKRWTMILGITFRSANFSNRSYVSRCCVIFVLNDAF